MPNEIVSRLIQDIKQAALTCRFAEDMRWAIEQCSLVQGLDEGERYSVLGLRSQSDLDDVLISHDRRSMNHVAGPIADLMRAH